MKVLYSVNQVSIAPIQILLKMLSKVGILKTPFLLVHPLFLYKVRPQILFKVFVF